MGLEYSVTTTPVKQNSSVEIRVSLLFSKPCKFCSCFSHIIKYVYTHDYTQASSHKYSPNSGQWKMGKACMVSNVV